MYFSVSATALNTYSNASCVVVSLTDSLLHGVEPILYITGLCVFSMCSTNWHLQSIFTHDFNNV